MKNQNMIWQVDSAKLVIVAYLQVGYGISRGLGPKLTSKRSSGA